MPLPESLQGDFWTPAIAKKLLPLLVSYAEACRPVTYGELSQEAIRRGWSHYVMPIAYRYAAGAIGYAIEETEEEWDEPIPPLNALVINENTGLPGKGVDYFLKTYLRQTGSNKRITPQQRNQSSKRYIRIFSTILAGASYFSTIPCVPLQSCLIHQPKRKGGPNTTGVVRLRAKLTKSSSCMLPITRGW